MKKITYFTIVVSAMTFGMQSISAQVYEVPPSSTVRGSVPWISDHAMEKCVILYNEAKNLKLTMDGMYVDRYSQSSVSAYNSQVNQHSTMIQKFNSDCAGKQSESAYKAAQKLNRENRRI